MVHRRFKKQQVEHGRDKFACGKSFGGRRENGGGFFLSSGGEQESEQQCANGTCFEC